MQIHYKRHANKINKNAIENNSEKILKNNEENLENCITRPSSYTKLTDEINSEAAEMKLLEPYEADSPKWQGMGQDINFDAVAINNDFGKGKTYNFNLFNNYDMKEDLDNYYILFPDN